MGHSEQTTDDIESDDTDDWESDSKSLETDERLRLSRRSVLQTAAVTAGAGILGIGATGSALGAPTVNRDFLNWRAREASKVWERGYRGRADRTIVLTDSGLEPRHPDEGPWNGITAFVKDGEVKLTRPAENDLDRVKAGSENASGFIAAGTFVEGSEEYHEFTTPPGVDELDAVLSWSPSEPVNDLEFRIDRLVNGEWKEVARAATGSTPEKLSIAVDTGQKYRYVVENYTNAGSNYEITGTYFDIQGTRTVVGEDQVFADVGGAITADTPKTMGWYDASARYGSSAKPRDGAGHGTHVTGIMGASGRGSAIDANRYQEEEPHAVLALGDTLTYEVTAEADTGVFGSAYGDAIEVVIEGPDGRELDASTTTSDASLHDNNLVEAPTIHGSGTATYTIYVRAVEGELVSTARLERVVVGAFLKEDETVGERTADGDAGLETGIAPNQGVVGLQGLSSPTVDLGEHADDFARIFNMRAVNMSWGYVGGLPLGAAGGTVAGNIVRAIKQIAQGGILTCASAGNTATPANGNGAPAVADEAISVVATGDLDGIAGYSSGGIGAIDEDEFDTYMKPDVTAPGGTLTELVNATKRGLPNESESEQPPIRDYTRKAGTSMASPYTTGTAGLVAQAMEEDAPAGVALPAPADTGIDDVFRLKQVLLATASETVFTAAPYHRAKAPTYEFGGRDFFEGFGRVNPTAAVDAVTRELSGTTSETVGLNLPEDDRAVAGFVTAGPGTLTAEVDFQYYSGGNKGATKGNPHIDLFVYDAENPAPHGEPNIVARAQGLQGDASASVSFGRDASEGVYYVVAKLVNVPGLVNGYDVQAHLDLSVNVEPGVFVSGTRTDDGSVFTAGQTNQNDITVNPSQAGPVRDAVPTEWDVLADFSDDVARVEQAEGVQYVYFTEKATANTQNEYTYFAEAPDSGSLVGDTGSYTFGPVDVEIDGEWVAVSGTSETNYVVGADTNL